ncbi:MAG TPA: threonine/serine dehydratase [Polyangiaceae bacterium]|jgi:threonine dehydratase|nr:threonine/serine dehydratase [Polyangiaceae bacterium]
MNIPVFRDVLLAQRRIRPHLRPTPLHSYPALNALIGAEVHVKHEDHQPTGAFKVRGGVNLIAQLSPEERARGVISASTGNHGQSLAFAARLFGIEARIVVPERANPGKVAAIQGMGAEVIFHGEHFEQARVRSEELARERGYRCVHAANEPALIAGVATASLEMLEEQPDIDVIFVPVGGGSGASGACIVSRAINPAIRVIGVQAEAAPAAYQSWQTRELVEAPSRTFAEGLATGLGFAMPQAILRTHLSDFILVSDDEMLQAMLWMIERAHTLAEAAGASALAAAYQKRDELRGKKVGLICSGGNTSLEHLRRALNRIE